MKLACLNHVFAQSSQALRAQLHADKNPILQDFGLLNVRLELALGMPLGKTDVVPELRLFATSFADCHNHFTFCLEVLFYNGA